MVWMVEQSAVSGQQRPEDELSRDMQFSLEGQWKSLGSLGSTAEHDTESSRLASAEKYVASVASASRAEDNDTMVAVSHSRRSVGILDSGRMVLGFEREIRCQRWNRGLGKSKQSLE